MKNSSRTVCPEAILDCILTANLSDVGNTITGIGEGWTANITKNTTFPSVFPKISLQLGGVHDGSSMQVRIENVRIAIYSLIIIISLFGNGLLVLTMMLTKKMRTTTNYFLLNMAVGDVLVAVFCAPYQLASWKFPSIKTFDVRICKSMPFIQLSTVGVSIYTMVAIAFIR